MDSEARSCCDSHVAVPVLSASPGMFCQDVFVTDKTLSDSKMDDIAARAQRALPCKHVGTVFLNQ